MKQIASSLCARAVYSTHLKLNGWLRSPLTYIVYVHHKLPTTISTNTCKLSNDRKNRKLYRVECRVYDACNLVSGKYGEYVIYNCTHNRNTNKEEKSKNPRDTQSKHNRPYESACCTVCVCVRVWVQRQSIEIDSNMCIWVLIKSKTPASSVFQFSNLCTYIYLVRASDGEFNRVYFDRRRNEWSHRTNRTSTYSTSLVVIHIYICTQ